jgi:hypothetical protein
LGRHARLDSLGGRRRIERGQRACEVTGAERLLKNAAKIAVAAERSHRFPIRIKPNRRDNPMLAQILLALILTAATVIIHAAGLVRVVTPFSGIWPQQEFSRQAAIVPLIRLVSGLLLLHLLEMGVWAAAYFAAGVLPDFETSLYYSLTSYTTVGYGDVVLPARWRLVGPIEAAVGVLMLGLSTGVIVAAVQRIYSRRVDSR